MRKGGCCGGAWIVVLGVVMVFVFGSACLAEEKPVIPLEGVPSDFSLVYGTGATHADWGRTTYRISADGKVLHERSRRSQRQKKEYLLTKEDMAAIISKIRERRFFDLEEHYANPKVHDGWSSYITVTMDGRKHGVSLRNMHQADFGAVAETISSTISRRAEESQ